MTPGAVIVRDQRNRYALLEKFPAEADRPRREYHTDLEFVARIGTRD